MRRAAILLGALAAMPAAGCWKNMRDQPRYEPLEASRFWEDGRASRPVVPGTVARGQLFPDALLHTGRVNGELSGRLPRPVDRDMLERGRERFNIFCAVCHDRAGYGRGMIVQRGFRQPASFHTERLRSMPVGYFFDVITNGFGAMYSYHDRIPVEDRWAIVAYIRALQLSQNAPFALVPEAARQELEAE